MDLLQKFGLTKRFERVDEERAAFVRDYSAALARLREIRANFDFAVDEALTDALIFEENAAVKLLEKLIRDAKSRKITIEFYENQPKLP